MDSIFSSSTPRQASLAMTDKGFTNITVDIQPANAVSGETVCVSGIRNQHGRTLFVSVNFRKSGKLKKAGKNIFCTIDGGRCQVTDARIFLS